MTGRLFVIQSNRLGNLELIFGFVAKIEGTDDWVFLHGFIRHFRSFLLFQILVTFDKISHLWRKKYPISEQNSNT